MSNFITNQRDHKTVAGRLKALVEHSAELKFLVGFFYFSGWGELYESLKGRDDLSIKLLVGLDVDELLGKAIEHGNSSGNASGDEKVDCFFDSLRVALNNENMDTEEFYSQVSFFLELIESGRLEIKKTLEPNHAKLYLFKAKAELGGWSSAKFITGSSNLTRAGLRGQNEFNVEIGDYGTEEAEDYFDKLWRTALEITADDGRRQRLIGFVKNQSQAADVTPFEAYTLMLKTYVELQELKQIRPQVVRLLEDNGYKKYTYQLDSVSQALTIIDTYNGVLLADVVGLGKSVIASMIAKSLGRRGLILCSPGLMGSENGDAGGWHMYRHHFKLHDWAVRSVGKLEETLEYLNSTRGEDIEVVIVDEAHRFRNQDTESYELLSHICRGRKVILLTATPFNNSPADIFSMLKLFMVPGQSGITLDDNFEDRFAYYNVLFRDLSFISRHHNSADSDKRSKAEQLYMKMFDDLPIDLIKVKDRSHELAADIRAMLEPVLIRRNRIDLKNDHLYSEEVTEIPETRDPVELFFELDHSQANFYQTVIEQYFGEGGDFKGAIYQPFNYEGGQAGAEEDEFVRTSQRNLYEFMRRLLVKRFESSFGAFYESICRFERLHDIVLQFIDRSGGRYVLDRKLIEKMYEDDEEEILEALTEFTERLEEDNDSGDHDRVYLIEEFQQKEEFLKDIRDDLALFTRIKEMLDTFGLVENDPKRDRLIEELRRIRESKESPRRKVILFTEYIDTVSHLRPALEEAFDGQVLSVPGGTLTKSIYNKIYNNFDASVDEDKQEDDFQILIASDKLSEGYNLNRAGAIINYDIPWNPTRVIQRVGRINRIGKKMFDELFIYNFFPTEQGANIVQSREIAAQKMFLIHNILGEDTKIFDPDEEPSAAELFKRINRNPEQLEEESLLTMVRNRLDEIREKYPAVMDRVSQLPDRVKTAKGSDSNQLVVLQKKALGLFVQIVADTNSDNPKVKELNFVEMLPFIECDLEEARLDLSEHFWPAYEAVKSYRHVHRKTHSENAVETKAEICLKSAVQNFSAELGDLLPFVRMLIKDICKYHTLPKYTLRSLARFEHGKKDGLNAFKKAIEKLRRLLGSDYLDEVTRQSRDYRNKVIIAIENCKRLGD